MKVRYFGTFIVNLELEQEMVINKMYA